MKKWLLVVILSVLLALTSASCAKHNDFKVLIERQGFIVLINANGEAKDVKNWDGSEVIYQEGEDKRIALNRTILALFPQRNRGPASFLKKVNGKWMLVPWTTESTPNDSAQSRNDAEFDGLIAIFGPGGEALRVMNPDGSELQSTEKIDLGIAALVSQGSHCCWKRCGGGACCQCNYCPWGCSH